MLSQRTGLRGKLQPWAFFSCCLTTTEPNCDAEDCELLAVKLGTDEAVDISGTTQHDFFPIVI